MSERNFTESVVEDAALAWLESLGFAVKHGPEIAPGELFAERGDYGQVILATRLREALVRLNPALPAEAIDDAFRKIIRLEGAALEERNRAFHRLLVNGVTVEYRRTDGAIGGAQARVSTLRIRRSMTGSPLINSPSLKTNTTGGRMSSSSSTVFHSLLLS